jgi:hypothetical protein
MNKGQNQLNLHKAVITHISSQQFEPGDFRVHLTAKKTKNSRTGDDEYDE